MTEVHQLTQASEKVLADLNGLLVALRNGEESHGMISELKALLADKQTAVIVAEDADRMVGVGLVYVWNKVGRKKAFIEDVVVSETERGKGLGTLIMQKLIAFAGEKGAGSIVLSSNPDRKAAHALYEKLGFKKRETNFYRLEL